jgi:uroporphyrinogen-III synthase
VSTLPLEGLTIGMTADRRADEQRRLLMQRGATVVHGPVIRTATVDDDSAVHHATLDLLTGPPSVVIANTALGIRSWLALADSWGRTDELVSILRGAYVAARGAKVAGALLAVDVEVDWRAPRSVLGEVIRHLVDRGVDGQRVVLQLDGAGVPGPEGDQLREAGADVVEVQTYRWGLPRDRGPARRLIDAACRGQVDGLTFTAAPAIRNLFAIAGDAGMRHELRDALNGPVLAMCVGPVCRQAAVEVGVHTAVEPDLPRLGGMVKGLGDELAGRRRVFVVDGVDGVLQGSMVRAGDAAVALASRERSVFERLARRPGVVVPRGVLLTDVWGPSGVDTHALEVTVGRLRRRLAPTGLTVTAVPRRGYRLTARRP